MHSLAQQYARLLFLFALGTSIAVFARRKTLVLKRDVLPTLFELFVIFNVLFLVYAIARLP